MDLISGHLDWGARLGRWIGALDHGWNGHCQVGIEGEAIAQFCDPAQTVLGDGVILRAEQAIGDDIGDFHKFGLAHAPGGHGRRA